MARVGQKIRLECEVTGIPRPELYWTQNGKPFAGRDLKVSKIRACRAMTSHLGFAV